MKSLFLKSLVAALCVFTTDLCAQGGVVGQMLRDIPQDPDAAAYCAAAGNPKRIPVTLLVRRSKSDPSPNAGVSNWDALKVAGLLAGPETFAGAFVTVKGVAPTNVNFVAADHNPATGLLGDGATKYLNSNRNNNADPQNNQSLGVWITTPNTVSAALSVMGTGTAAGGSGIGTAITTGDAFFRSRSSTATTSDRGVVTGLLGQSRHESAGYNYRANGVTVNFSNASSAPLDAIIWVFQRNNVGFFADGRFSFYWIGEAVDMTALDAALAAYMGSL